MIADGFFLINFFKRLIGYLEQLQTLSSIFHRVVATEAPPPPSIREDGNPLSSSPHEISPSIEEEPTDRSKFHSARTARAFSNNFIVTLVSTVTNYVFNTTFIRKTITPAIANAQLSCLPPGMTVC